MGCFLLCCCSKVVDCVIDSACCTEYHLSHNHGEQIIGGNFNGRVGYSYCGPFTSAQDRYAQGYRGVNELDSLCMKHDIGYSTNKDNSKRAECDAELELEATKLSNDPDQPENVVRDAKKVAWIIGWIRCLRTCRRHRYNIKCDINPSDEPPEPGVSGTTTRSPET